MPTDPNRSGGLCIGIDARPLTYTITGIGTYLRHLLEALQHLDHRNRYRLFSNGPIALELFNPRWRKVSGTARSKLLSGLWFALALPVLAARGRIDLFWGPRHHLPPWLPGRVARVVTVHDVVHRRFPHTMTLGNLMTERVFMGPSLRRAHRIITDSLSTAADVRSFFKIDPGRIRTIYPGPPPIAAAEALPRGLPPRYYLFVGTLDPRKNLPRVLAAFQRTGRLDRSVDLVIAGDRGWRSGDLRRQLRRHPLAERIHTPGYVSHRRLAGLYGNALALVFPSLHEGFGFPVLEAMSVGVPVIAGNRSSLPEVVASAALKVDPGDTQAIAAAMLRLSADDGLRRRLSAAGRKRAGEFSWQRCAAQTLAELEKAYANAHSPRL